MTASSFAVSNRGTFSSLLTCSSNVKANVEMLLTSRYGGPSLTCVALSGPASPSAVPSVFPAFFRSLGFLLGMDAKKPAEEQVQGGLSC